MLAWRTLSNAAQLEEIIEQSQESPVAIFKHSTRCAISITVKKLFETQWSANDNNFPVYYLDLLNYRSLSNQIAGDFEVEHESPQVLVFRNGQVVYHASHEQINAAISKEFVE